MGPPLPHIAKVTEQCVVWWGMRRLMRTAETSKQPAETQFEWVTGRKQTEMFGETFAL